MYESEIKSLLDDILERDTKVLYKTPFASLNWYGKDQPENIKYLSKGHDNPIMQDVDWSKEAIEYNFNSMGLRGPEIDASKDTKIIFAGGSFTFGSGVHEHQTFAHKLSKHMDASYINISDSDSLLGLLQPILKTAEWYKPDYLVLGDTRFVDEYGWLVRLTKAKILKKVDSKTSAFLRDKYVKILNERNYNSVYLMLSHLKDKLNIPIYFLISNRKDFNFDTKLDIDGVEVIECEWGELFMDLSRDNSHPGPLSHDQIYLELYNHLSCLT